MGFWSALLRILVPRLKTAPDNPYPALRQQILTLKADMLRPAPSGPVHAVVMETGYPDAVVTLVAVADGKPASSHPMPAKGMTQFFVLTRAGPLTAGARE